MVVLVAAAAEMGDQPGGLGRLAVLQLHCDCWSCGVQAPAPITPDRSESELGPATAHWLAVSHWGRGRPFETHGLPRPDMA